MDKRVVVPVAVAIVVGGAAALAASKLLTRPKNQDQGPAASTSGEEKLTETQRALQDPAEMWRRA